MVSRIVGRQFNRIRFTSKHNGVFGRIARFFWHRGMFLSLTAQTFPRTGNGYTSAYYAFLLYMIAEKC